MSKSISQSFRRKSLRAFTLLELIVVIAIISVLAAVIIPNAAAYLRDSRVSEANTQAQEVYNAVQDCLISQQIRGEKAFGYTGSASEIYIGAVTTGGKSNYTVFGGASDFTADQAEKAVLDITGGERKDNTGAIQGYNTGYLTTGFEGAWLVCIYPKTYTVKCALFCDNYNNDYNNKKAKLDVLDTMYTGDDLYSNINGQDNDANNASSDKRYVGQYPYIT